MAPTVGPVSAVTAVVMALAFPFWNFQADVSQRPDEVTEIMPAPEVAVAKVPVKSPKMLGADKSKPSTSEAMEFWPQWLTPLQEGDMPQGLTLLHETGPAFLFMCATALVAATAAVILCMTCIKRRRVHSHIEPQKDPEGEGHGNTAMAGRLLITFEEGVRAEEIMEEVKVLPMVTRTDLLSIGIANADVTDMDAGDRALKGISGVASVEIDATVTIAGNPGVLPEQPTGFDGEANHLFLEPQEKPEDEVHGNTATAGRLLITFEEGVSAQEIMEEVKVLPMVTYTELLSIGIASVDVTDMIVGDRALQGISGVASVERDATVTIASEPGVLAEQPNGFDGVANSSFNKPTSDKLESARNHVLNFAATRIQAAHRGCYARRIAREVCQKQELEEERQSRVTCRKCRSCRNTGKDFMGNICSCEYGKAVRQLQSAFQAWADTLTAESDALLVEICTSEEQRNAGFVQDESASIAQKEHETSDLPNEFDTPGAIVEVGEFPDGLEPHLDESGVPIGSEHAYETDKRLVASEDDEAAGIATDSALNENCPDIPLLGQQPPEKSKVELEAMLAEEAETMDEDILRVTCGGPRHDDGVAQTLGLGPAWTRGEIEAPRGVKDMGTWTSHVYTAEQQERLGVDETGKPLAASEDDEAVGIAFDAALNENSADLPSLGQDSLENGRVELEATLAQEAEIIDEDILQAPDSVLHHGGEVAQTLGLGPAWTRGEIEAPRGVKDMGTWTSHVYTAEQQERLCVDETGKPLAASEDDAAAGLACDAALNESSAELPCLGQQSLENSRVELEAMPAEEAQTMDEDILQAPDGVFRHGGGVAQALGLGPAWTRGEIEAPRGVKDMGTWTSHVYTAEQQERLGVDETGKPLAALEDFEAVGIAFDAALNESSADLPSLGQDSLENGRVELEAMLAQEAEIMDEDILQAPDSVLHHGGGVTKTLGLGPAWTRGEIEAPRGVKDMGTWTSHVYTAEQQERLCVDETGKPLAASEDDAAAGIASDAALNESSADLPSLGQQSPENSRVELESMLAEEAATMDEDIPQAADGVPRHGCGVAQTFGLGPAWTRGEIEAPRGVKDMGTWTSHVYTAEQRERLGVDETGEPVFSLECNQDSSGYAPERQQQKPRVTGNSKRQYQQLDESEPPAGVKVMGGRSELVYTLEQQQRLGVDESGFYIEAGEPERPKSEYTGEQLVSNEATLAENFDENELRQEDVKQTPIKFMKEPAQCSPLIQRSPLPVSRSRGRPLQRRSSPV